MQHSFRETGKLPLNDQNVSDDNHCGFNLIYNDAVQLTCLDKISTSQWDGQTIPLTYILAPAVRPLILPDFNNPS